VSLTPSFLAALRVSDIPGYRLASDAGLDPTLLTKLVRGARPIREHHAVALNAIARRLGLPRAIHKGRVMNLGPSRSRIRA